MKLLPLILVALVGCHKPTPPVSAPPSEPSALGGDLAELHAFAELVGLVRFFHPSDESASTPWDLFVIHGAGILINEPGFNSATLQGLFSPIAPTLQLALEAPPTPMPFPEAGDRVVAWGHRSVGLGAGGRHGHQSFRQGRSTPVVSIKRPVSWLHRSFVLPDPLPLRWRFTLDISGEPDANIIVSAWEWGEGGSKRISRSTHTARAAGGATRSQLVMEHDTAGLVDAVYITLTPHAMQAVTLHEATMEWGDDEGNWTTVPVPLVLSEDSKTGWIKRGRKGGIGYTISEESGDLVCTRDGDITSEPAFDVPTQLGETWQGPVGGGLFASVPLALPGDENHTHPRGQGAEAEAAWRQALAAHQGDDRSDPAIRVASVIQAWTVMRHFHPHPESITGTWEGMLDEALADAVEGGRPLPELLGRLLAHLPDGHINILDGQRMWMRFPLRLEEVDGRVFVLSSSMPELAPGDELVRSSDQPVRVILDRTYAQSPGTDQWRRAIALNELRTAPGKELTVTVSRAGIEETLTLSFDKTEAQPRIHELFEDLGEGLFYLDLREPDVLTDARLETLAGARGLMVDLRGYPNNTKLLNHLTPEGAEPYHDWASYPLRVRPDTIMAWEGTGFSPEATPPHLDLPVVWLTGPRAISFSESYLGWARHHDPDARFVGATPTAGANGVNHEFGLLGGFSVGWTSMRATMIDGSPYFGRGIGLDETVPWTTSAVLEGRDPAFEAAQDWLRGKEVPEPFLGTWKDEDGGRLLVTRDSVNHFEGARWIGREPILEWTEEGPTLCAGGLPLSGTLTRQGEQIMLVDGKRRVDLSRLDASDEMPKPLAMVLPEPPPSITPEQATELAGELSTRSAAAATARSGEGDDVSAIDTDNGRWLKEQLERVGWIDSERYGLQASEDAFLLAQRSGDLGMLIAVASRLRGVTGREASWAIMVDQIAVSLGEPQRHGTQLRSLPDGTTAILPVTDIEQVTAARLALALEPWPIALGAVAATGEVPLLDCTEAFSRTVPSTRPLPE